MKNVDVEYYEKFFYVILIDCLRDGSDIINNFR